MICVMLCVLLCVMPRRLICIMRRDAFCDALCDAFCCVFCCVFCNACILVCVQLCVMLCTLRCVLLCILWMAAPQSPAITNQRVPIRRPNSCSMCPAIAASMASTELSSVSSIADAIAGQLLEQASKSCCISRGHVLIPLP